jgi:hypothetical protein
MILLLVAICASIPVAFGMKWLNIKNVSKERGKEQAGVENQTVFLNNQDRSSAREKDR